MAYSNICLWFSLILILYQQCCIGILGIEGINIDGKEWKISKYADDTSISDDGWVRIIIEPF